MIKILIFVIMFWSTVSEARTSRGGGSTGGESYIEIWPGENCIDIIYHMTWVNVVGSSVYGCQSGCISLDSAGDADPDASGVTINVGGCGAGMEVSSNSTFWNRDCNYIKWRGAWNAYLNDGGCSTTLQTFAASHGFAVAFSTVGTDTITFSPPDCTPTTSSTQSPSRHVLANLLCVQDTGGAQSIASHTVFMNGYTASTCQTDDIIIEASGTVHVISFAIYLDDEQDDITSDGRFNQADVDFLASIVGTTDAIDPAYAKFDYVNDPTTPTDDGVETQDIEILQCFIDAGLSSGHLADANQNGPLDCEDVALAVAQPFAGEAFPASSYSVEFDADLDGDNDAADKVAIANALLTVEPANFQFDAVLNFFDSTEFTTLYNNNDPRADLFPVGSPDGIFNFFDVVQFQAYYNNPSCL